MTSQISNERKRIIVNQETIVKWINKKLRKQGHRPPPMPTMTMNMITTKHFEMTDTLRERIIELTPLFIEEVELMPLLPRNLCHHNSQLLIEVLNAKEEIYEQVVGYNMTACGCRKFWSMELHSVIRAKKTGEIFDLTTDFDGLTKKWFIGMNVIDSDEDVLSMVRFIIDNEMDWVFSMKSHKCNNKDSYMQHTGKEDFDAFKKFWVFMRKLCS